MIPKHYADGASRISAMSVPPVETPDRVDVMWIRTHSYERRSRKTNLQEHKHSFFEAHFVFQGRIVYEIAGQRYELTDGRALLIPPELPHRICGFSEGLVKVNLSFCGMEAAFAPFTGGGYPFRICDGMMEDFDRIFAEAARRDGYGAYVIRDRVFSILCTVLRSSGSATQGFSLERGRFVCEIAARYVEDNKHLFLNCAEVAAHCACSEKYLSRCFRRYYGTTLLSYIHEVKLREAERLLLGSEALLSEIAEVLGFANEHYFNSFFKRYRGGSPGTFRRSGGATGV